MARSTLLLLLSVSLYGCKSDVGYQAQTRILQTQQATFEPGVVAVNDRETVNVYLASVGQSPVTVYGITMEVEDGSADDWVILDTWKTQDDDGDGVNDSAEIAGGSESDPTFQLVEVSYRPTTAGRSRAKLIIESNDNVAVETIETEDGKTHAIWKTAIRGVSQYPCGSIYPDFYDFGPHPAGSYWNTPFTIENCGNVTLTVSSYDVTGDNSYYVDSVFPIYVQPGTTEPIKVAWEPASSAAESAKIDLVTNAPAYDDQISLIGNDCENSVDTDWDQDGDGWFECGGDCDDHDDEISPSTPEDESNGIDDDCDSDIDEGMGLNRDNDLDLVTETDGDCDDNDAAVYPGADEVVNQIDDDCDGKTDEGSQWYDDDGDGFAEREGDCDDKDEKIHPGADEDYDTVDNDCDDLIDESTYSFDDDADGYAEIGLDGSDEDCDDADPWTYPGAQEDCDGVDNDCDNVIDEGEDDTVDGACEFLVEQDEDAVAGGEKSTCATGPGRAGATLSLLGLALLAKRRRRA